MHKDWFTTQTVLTSVYTVNKSRMVNQPYFKKVTSAARRQLIYLRSFIAFSLKILELGTYTGQLSIQNNIHQQTSFMYSPSWYVLAYRYASQSASRLDNLTFLLRTILQRFRLVIEELYVANLQLAL